MVEGPRWKRIRRAALRGLRRAEIKSYRSKELICLSFSLFSLSFHPSPSPPLSLYTYIPYIYHSSFRSLLLLQLVLSVSLLESGNGNIDDVPCTRSCPRCASPMDDVTTSDVTIMKIKIDHDVQSSPGAGGDSERIMARSAHIT